VLVAHTCNPTSGEAGIGRIIVGGQPGPKVYEIPISKNGRAQWHVLVIENYAGAKSQKTMVPGLPRQKSLQDPISMEKSWA
jgi:hypothetical protein